MDCALEVREQKTAFRFVFTDIAVGLHSTKLRLKLPAGRLSQPKNVFLSEQGCEVAVARRCEILMNRITMRPSTMPKLSLMTLARGARQLVVQEALLRGRDEESVVIHTNYNKASRDTEHISSVRMFEICFIQTDS